MQHASCAVLFDGIPIPIINGSCARVGTDTYVRGL